PDADTAQLGQFAAIKARQHDRATRMTRRRSDQRVDLARRLHFVAPAQCLDDPLDMAPAFARVLHQVQILVGSDLLDADKHCGRLCSQQSTTNQWQFASKIRHKSPIFISDLAPQITRPPKISSLSAILHPPKTSNCGSWVKNRVRVGNRGIVVQKALDTQRHIKDRRREHRDRKREQAERYAALAEPMKQSQSILYSDHDCS